VPCLSNLPWIVTWQRQGIKPAISWSQVWWPHRPIHNVQIWARSSFLGIMKLCIFENVINNKSAIYACFHFPNSQYGSHLGYPPPQKLNEITQGTWHYTQSLPQGAYKTLKVVFHVFPWFFIRWISNKPDFLYNTEYVTHFIIMPSNRSNRVWQCTMTMYVKAENIHRSEM